MKNVYLSFGKGILAGLSIGLGGFLYVILTHFVVGEVGKILGSIAFAIGLFLVCTFSLSLYTGKIGVCFEGKQNKDFYISLPVMLLGNAIGAFALGYACYFLFRDTKVMETVDSVCSSRTTLSGFQDYLLCAVRSFLCGTCVYLAVKCFGKARLKPLGIFLLVFFVFLFVYCGFQHCVANMFYFGFGNHMKIEMALNLLVCITFNSFGPVVGVLLFRLLDRENKPE